MTVFDRIINGDLPASVVYRDAVCMAFLDIAPMTVGHTLVVPLVGVPHIADLDDDTLAHLWRVARDVASAQRAALGSDAQHFLVNDGKAASQTVPHVHIHVIPRYRGDSLRAVSRMIWHATTLAIPRPESRRRRARLDALAARIAGQISPSPV